MKRRILAILLSLCLVSALTPIMTMAVETDSGRDPDITVFGVSVIDGGYWVYGEEGLMPCTEAEDWDVKYSVEDRKLTFSNLEALNYSSLDTVDNFLGAENVYGQFGIVSTVDLEIELLGRNKITLDQLPASSGRINVGILAFGTLELTGDGSLEIVNGGMICSNSVMNANVGIYCDAELSIECAELCVTGGNVEAKKCTSLGITAAKVIINGCDTRIYSGEVAGEEGESTALYADEVFINDAFVTAMAANTTQSFGSGPMSIGTYACSITLDNSIMESSARPAFSKNYGVLCEAFNEFSPANVSITMTNSKLLAYANGSDAEESMGIRLEGNMTATNGEVHGVAGEADLDSCGAYIKGSVVFDAVQGVFHGAASYRDSIALKCAVDDIPGTDPGLSVSNNSFISFQSSDAGCNGYGLYCVGSYVEVANSDLLLDTEYCEFGECYALYSGEHETQVGEDGVIVATLRGGDASASSGACNRWFIFESSAIDVKVIKNDEFELTDEFSPMDLAMFKKVQVGIPQKLTLKCNNTGDIHVGDTIELEVVPDRPIEGQIYWVIANTPVFGVDTILSELGSTFSTVCEVDADAVGTKYYACMYGPIHSDLLAVEVLAAVPDPEPDPIPSYDYTPSYTIKFNVNGGDAFRNRSFSYGSIIKLSDYVPTYAGHIFLGWYFDKELEHPVISNNLKITEGMELYAKWAKAPTFSNFKTVNEYRGFSDVNEGAWYGSDKEGCIARVVGLGLMTGYDANHFGPNDNLTEYQALVVACRLHSIYNGNTDLTDDWDNSRGYIAYAVDNGIVAGLKDIDFLNNMMCSRELAAELVYNVLGKSLDSVSLGDDVNTERATPPDIDTKTATGEKINALYEIGLLNGVDADGTFNGKESISRAAMTALLSRTSQLKDK